MIKGFDLSVAFEKAMLNEKCKNLMKNDFVNIFLLQSEEINKISGFSMIKLLDYHEKMKKNIEDRIGFLDCDEIANVVNDYCQVNYQNLNERTTKMLIFSKRYLPENSFEIENMQTEEKEESLKEVRLKFVDQRLLIIEKHNTILRQVNGSFESMLTIKQQEHGKKIDIFK